MPADYVLGPDDQLLIRAWGKIELNSRVTVDRNGQISLPRVGTLNVAGIRYSQVESYLRSAIGALFKDFELNVTLGRLRTIQIYVLGNARQPGAYTVSSLSTLVDALFSSGGPSATGTMRDIQLRRDGKIVTEFDFYDLVAKGDKSKDVRLVGRRRDFHTANRAADRNQRRYQHSRVFSKSKEKPLLERRSRMLAE